MDIIKKETEYIFQGEDEEEKVIISLSNDRKKVHIKFFHNPVDFEEIVFDTDFFTNYLWLLIRDLNTRTFTKRRSG
ncbi:hypothetical protein [Halanaerobium congolense]|uniref:Uncharacterized protein n=1 Tax=Halanaerobium congolense TaxID=54121 RepID=A0A4R7DZX4_9FIRM|nr:hypothetical protein [Halanaerobium congolense]TDS28039.1 hypothetical protein BY453_12317 [Halanaerobium congolense]